MMTVSPPPKHWKVPFFTIWTGQAFSLLGSHLISFALIWYLTRLTGSATVLAMASLVGLLPYVLLGPIAGTLVDRWNRRVVMIVADTTVAIATAVLAFLFYQGGVEVWQIFVIMGVRSVAGSFHYPAMQASTTLMVPPEHYARIQGLNQMLQGLMNILAAPLGALLLEFMPMQGVLMIDVFTALLAVAPLFFIAVPQPIKKLEASGETGKTTVWQEFKQGFRYAFSWPGLVIIGLMATLINLILNPAFSLLPLLVTKHFNGQAIQLAWMESAFGVGIILGGLLLGVWGGFKRRILTAMLGLFGLGMGVLALGLVPSFAFVAAVAIMFWLGLANPITNGPLMAAVQAAVEPEMQGRIFTIIGSVAGLMSPLGLMLAGPIADRFGIQTWFLVGGVVTLLMAISSFFIPAVMNFEKGRNGKAPVEAEPEEIVISAAD
jgi:DHA3 family macrolide efflux protein-like MFS transporter